MGGTIRAGSLIPARMPFAVSDSLSRGHEDTRTQRNADPCSSAKSPARAAARRKSRPSSTLADDRSHRVGPWPTGRRAGCPALISAVAPSRSLAGDASYDRDGLRRFLPERGTTPVIPNNATRKRPHPFDEDAYPISSNACSAVSSIGDASPRATINSQQTSPQPSPPPPSSSGGSD
jgi:hypothetical protein